MDKHWLISKMEEKRACLGVIGLGYVGLPLAVAFARKFNVIGFDISERKINELRDGIDTTGEIEDLSLLKLPTISYTTEARELERCEVIIVAVPTPVDRGNKPDLTPVLSASRTVGRVLSDRPVYVCFESTVYPGCTEEDCLPAMEKESGKKHGVDFFLGYSPERINPGDKVHRFETIKKVVSGCNPDSTELFAQLYGAVVDAGIHIAPSIKVAEAAKVIENAQRDINIAFVNELAVIFSRMGISTKEVLAAAATKWNFLNFKPGLVGGHCIGVDPYYLTYKAESLGYRPRVILSGRGVNDSMAEFVATEAVKKTIVKPPKNGIGYRALVMGFTFKENCPDVRNTKSADLVRVLMQFGMATEVTDPIGNPDEVRHEYGISLQPKLPSTLDDYDLIVLAVAHEEYAKQLPSLLKVFKGSKGRTLIVDVKGILKEESVSDMHPHLAYWCL